MDPKEQPWQDKFTGCSCIPSKGRLPNCSTSQKSIRHLLSHRQMCPLTVMQCFHIRQVCFDQLPAASQLRSAPWLLRDTKAPPLEIWVQPSSCFVPCPLGTAPWMALLPPSSSQEEKPFISGPNIYGVKRGCNHTCSCLLLEKSVCRAKDGRWSDIVHEEIY